MLAANLREFTRIKKAGCIASSTRSNSKCAKNIDLKPVFLIRVNSR